MEIEVLVNSLFVVGGEYDGILRERKKSSTFLPAFVPRVLRVLKVVGMGEMARSDQRNLKNLI